MKALVTLFPFLILYVFGPVSITGADQKARAVCYFNNWAVKNEGVGRYTIDDIPGDKCTHVVYTFVGVSDVDWGIQSLDEETDITNNGFANFTALPEKYPGLLTFLGIGGESEGGEKFSTMANDPLKRESFIESAISYMNNYGFNGFHIDWEWPEPQGVFRNDKDNFRDLVSELREAFDQEGKGWEISLAVPLNSSKVENGYHVPELCSAVDAVHVIAHDLRGIEGGVADVHSPLYNRTFDQGEMESLNANDGLHLWVDMGCPKHKVIMGVPLYGRNFTLSSPDNNDLGAPIVDTTPAGDVKDFMPYYEICPLLQGVLTGWTRKFDDVGKCPYAFKDTQWVGYEDAESLQIKMDFVKTEGFGGIAAWALPMDDFKGSCGEPHPLVSLVYENMKDYLVPVSSNATPRN